MKIYTAWADDPYGGLWLVSAYDEYTRDDHGGVPQFHIDAVENTGRDHVVRELVVEIPVSAVEGLFVTPTVTGSVVTESEAEGIHHRITLTDTVPTQVDPALYP